MALRIGCVSYLNSTPLVWGLDDDPQLEIIYEVPAKLLDLLLSDRCDVALLPAIDYHGAGDLVLVPSSCIGADGPVYTVRIFSRVHLESVTTVCADVESHTSVALCRILMHHLYGRDIKLVDDAAAADAILLIGDKVVTSAPAGHPYQLDLADAWKLWTKLPFVFATWMSRRGRDLGEAPQKLSAAMNGGMAHVEEIVARNAAAHGWPSAMAHHYLTHLLKFPIDLTPGAPQRMAMESFYQHSYDLGLIGKPRAVELYRP